MRFLAFMRFLGLELYGRGPDAGTIRLFRERLKPAGAIGDLFAVFERVLRTSGCMITSGPIADDSLVQAPKQRNAKEKREALKEGRKPEERQGKPAKLRQKDRDVRRKGIMGLFMRTIGPDRVRLWIGLINLADAMRRLVWLETRNAAG